jgi:hypothetical protein
MEDDTTLRFPARDLKPYGEYVESQDLVIGHVYFRVNFVDNDMLVPEVVPLVFVGRNLDSDDESRSAPVLYFQDYDSHSAGIRYENFRTEFENVQQSPEDLLEGPSFECTEETGCSGVFEFEKALNTLLACSLRRKTRR